MKKWILISLIVLCGGCSLFFPPRFFETALDETFSEKGSVVRLNLNYDSSTAGLAGVLMDLIATVPHQSNDIFLAVDTRDSVYPLSSYPGYVPFYWGNGNYLYNVIEGTEYPLINWDEFSPLGGYSNQFRPSSLDPGIWYLHLRVEPFTPTFDYIYSSNALYVLGYQVGNYFDSAYAKQLLHDNRYTGAYFRIIGYQDLSTANHLLYLSNRQGQVVIERYQLGVFEYWDPVGPEAYSNNQNNWLSNMPAWPAPSGSFFLTADKKGLGVKINGVESDWSLQTSHLTNKIPIGTRIRIIWENMPSEAPVTVWDNYPQGAAVSGNAPIFASNNTYIWTRSSNHGVFIDISKRKAIVDLEVKGQPLDRGINFKLVASDAGEYGVWERRPHFALLPDPVDGWITVIVDYDAP